MVVVELVIDGGAAPSRTASGWHCVPGAIPTAVRSSRQRLSGWRIEQVEHDVRSRTRCASAPMSDRVDGTA